MAALFTIAKTLEATWMSIDRGMDKEVVHIYNGILLSHKKEWNIAIWSNMDGPRDYHTKLSKSDKELSKSDKDKWYAYAWNLKNNDTDELIYKTEIDPQR